MLQPHRERRRHWQFSLRTLLFLMAVASVWLGWNVSLVARRKAALASIQSRGGHLLAYDNTSVDPKDPEWFRQKVQHAPSILRMWIGDTPVYYVNLMHVKRGASFTWAERERVSQLFPEAFVVPEHREAFE